MIQICSTVLFPSTSPSLSRTTPQSLISIKNCVGKVVSRLFVFCVAASLSEKKKQKTGYRLRAVIDE